MLVLNPKTNEAMDLFNKGLIALNKATKYGVLIDMDYVHKTDKFLSKRLKFLEQKIIDSDLGTVWKKYYPKINIRSDEQLRHVLFNVLSMPVVKETKKNLPSVDAGSLSILSSERPEIKFINDYRTIYTVHNTYIQGFIKESVGGIMRPGFPLHKVKTFRSSSEYLNFQFQPKRNPVQRKLVRRAIRPRKGKQFIAIDFSGIEVRIACCVTKDQKLMYDTVHGDMHRDLAIELYMLDQFEKKGSEKILRNGGKNGFVFPQFYGDYHVNNAPSLLKWALMPLGGKFKKKDGLELMNGEHVGENFIKKGIKDSGDFLEHVKNVETDFWENRYSVYNQWKKDNVETYHKKGYIHTKTGFTCQGLMSNNEANNYPIQGPAFHCLLKSFIEMDRRLEKKKAKSNLVLQIHDEMVVEAHPKEKDYILEEAHNIMTKWLPKQWKWINVPLEVEADVYPVDGSWAEKTESVVL